MDLFKKDDLDTLCEFASKPCVSMFMPMVKKGKETRQNTIRYKNILQKAQNQMKKVPEYKKNSQDILDPAKKLLNEYVFWQNQGHGLALFAASDFTRVYRLPIEFQETIVIADQFHVKPLLPLVTDDISFYVLAFQKDETQLYRGSRQAIEQLQPPDMPKGLAEALKFDDVERQFQFYSGSPPVAAPRKGEKRASVFYGQGVVSDQEKNRILQYCRIIDKALQAVLHDQDAPLVLAGLEHLLPIYMSANSYPHLVEDCIWTNPADLSTEELHQEAWNLIMPLRQRNLKIAMQKYHDLKGTGRTTDQLGTILEAGAIGRIDTLFVALKDYYWGKYDEPNHNVIHTDNPSVGDQDLLDLAARRTLENSGKVYPLETEELPDGALVAAILRY